MYSRNVHSTIEETMEFSNTLTIDNLDRSQLIALCKLLNLPFIGPTYYLRLKLHIKFHHLKN